MKFDKSRVYTAVNADELKVGSKCICANSISELKYYVTQKPKENIRPLVRIWGEKERNRFGNKGYAKYALAYLIEVPDEEKIYDEFEDTDDAMEAVKKHGGWIKHKTDGTNLFVLGYSELYLYTFKGTLSLNHLFVFYVFADDDSPCGKLVE